MKSLSPSARRARLWCIFLALLVKNGFLLAELKFRENTGQGYEPVLFNISPPKM